MKLNDNDTRLLLLNEEDNVFVLRAAVEAGETITVAGVTVQIGERIGMGHKLARRAIQPGEKVLKYGAPIGSVTRAVAIGEHVHLNNLKSDYTQTHSLEEARAANDFVEGANT
ncbi:MAG: UxaA family hydrolase [Rhizobiaceae bacterium]|nr:UxaA family hydrolase [Rhizobiaceae bacterium]